MKTMLCPRLHRFPLLFASRLAATVVALLLVGCVSTQDRASERPAAFRALSAADRNLVLSGQVREGMNKDAVFIAWGSPDRAFAGRAENKPFETWVYLTQRTTPTPAGPIYYGPYLGLYPRNVAIIGGRGRRGRYVNAGAYYDAAWLYRSEFQVSEVPYRKAVFIDGRLRSFETLTRDSR